MRRRDFISLGSGAALWPVVARAQPSATPHIIGFLGPTPAAIAATWFAAFVTRLGELGWKDGRDIEIEARWAEGQAGRLPQLAVDLVKLEPDVIVTWATVPALVVLRFRCLLQLPDRGRRKCCLCGGYVCSSSGGAAASSRDCSCVQGISRCTRV